jgi:hypothetical protein
MLQDNLIQLGHSSQQQLAQTLDTSRSSLFDRLRVPHEDLVLNILRS